uniref:DNA mismatch repair protein MutS n=1 Tax=Dictyoglomus thermophilum TaxID=14 RepID=A0A7C3MIH6_DICTH
MDVVKRELHFSERIEYKYNKEGWWLEALRKFINAVTKLNLFLSEIEVSSKGLRDFYAYLKEYVESKSFLELKENLEKVSNALEKVVFCLHIDGLKVMVYKYEEEDDKEYEEEIVRTFERFRGVEFKEYDVKIPIRTGMDHVENEIINAVAKLYPHTFELLDNFYTDYYQFLDKVIDRFSKEIKFYLDYLDFIKRFKENGLKFCYPEVTKNKEELYLYDGFDLALAYEKLKKNETIVVNDFWLKENERITLVTGPNQGGKTTFARMFGQIHYLTRLGVPIPGTKAKIFLCDNIFTHFEREEKVQNLKGKLESDLLELKQILNLASSESIIILNETFSSATMADAIFLAKNIIEKILELDCYAIYVTFLDEVASMDEKVVSMVATVSKEDPSIKTFKIIRKPADGKAYAILLAEKYSLTYEQLKRRLEA